MSKLKVSEINLLQTLALLKANWDMPQKKDYLDIFLPLVGECLKTKNEEIVTLDSLHPY